MSTWGLLKVSNSVCAREGKRMTKCKFPGLFVFLFYLLNLTQRWSQSWNCVQWAQTTKPLKESPSFWPEEGEKEPQQSRITIVYCFSLFLLAWFQYQPSVSAALPQWWQQCRQLHPVSLTKSTVKGGLWMPKSVWGIPFSLSRLLMLCSRAMWVPQTQTQEQHILWTLFM